ncbi:unnamed protein product [Porites lobata]|uniref:C3H1-type domain-containing protein n=1 Tax=Porites lobata TaxID=104759 RepID=A0ABN8QWE6_9CNID|nr:unnamed protein product [Porites lobata]
MELIARYDWKSILMYDNEFRKLQAIYKFSWSFDSTHLHTVLLQPIYEPNPPTATTKPSASNTYQRNAFASFTPDGRVICRNFNGPRGCTLPNCNFAHVCNRKIAGKACAMSHPGFSHKAVNDYITTNSFKFQTLDDATTLLRPNYYMAKIDLWHAYRSVPIHPDNYKATGCKWQFLGDHSYTYFYDTRFLSEPKAHRKSFIALRNRSAV